MFKSATVDLNAAGASAFVQIAASIPEIAGRARIAGQIIWATKFKEVATTTTQRSGGGTEVGCFRHRHDKVFRSATADLNGGGGGGGSVTSTTYSYFANFAVGLCEKPIGRIGRIWADGKPLSLAGITMRVYRGNQVGCCQLGHCDRQVRNT